uniref:Uncharacterized protein n=1 Tax=Magallana gigas TaxID=29159 RepID=K1PT19_MAGGI
MSGSLGGTRSLGSSPRDKAQYNLLPEAGVSSRSVGQGSVDTGHPQWILVFPGLKTLWALPGRHQVAWGRVALMGVVLLGRGRLRGSGQVLSQVGMGNTTGL